ncbi:MAG: universal stress protein [Burkholderiales bacterium]|nr:universal stress protein [Burkholderiales bacterium]
MKNVLVPVDGSKAALRAVAHAAAQAAPARAVVHLVNVEPKLDNYGMVRAYLSRKQHREATAARANLVFEPAAKLLDRAGVRYRTHLIYGDPPAAIVRAARLLKCEAIIMGTRGLGAIGRILLGSVASKVSQLSKVPVTLIR